MTNSNPSLHQIQDQQPEISLYAQWATLRARYDCGAVPTYLYAVIRAMEIELAWRAHQRRRS
jgi:hypothetical protein